MDEFCWYRCLPYLAILCLVLTLCFQAVGLAAKHGLIRNPKNTVCNVKQLLGLDYSHPAVAEISNASMVKVHSNEACVIFACNVPTYSQGQ